jgi:hypothetical protein
MQHKTSNKVCYKIIFLVNLNTMYKLKTKTKLIILFSALIKELIEKKILIYIFFLPYYKRRTVTKLILILLLFKSDLVCVNLILLHNRNS